MASYDESLLIYGIMGSPVPPKQPDQPAHEAKLCALQEEEEKQAARLAQHKLAKLLASSNQTALQQRLLAATKDAADHDAVLQELRILRQRRPGPMDLHSLGALVALLEARSVWLLPHSVRASYSQGLDTVAEAAHHSTRGTSSNDALAALQHRVAAVKVIIREASRRAEDLQQAQQQVQDMVAQMAAAAKAVEAQAVAASRSLQELQAEKAAVVEEFNQECQEHAAKQAAYQAWLDEQRRHLRRQETAAAVHRQPASAKHGRVEMNDSGNSMVKQKGKWKANKAKQHRISAANEAVEALLAPTSKATKRSAKQQRQKQKRQPHRALRKAGGGK